MINYLQYFFNPAHLFSLRPPAMSLRAVIILAAVFGLAITLGIASKIIERKTKDGLKVKAYRRLFNFGITMGLLGFFYLFFAWQSVTLLAARFWLLGWVITFIAWLGFILKYLFLEVPKTRQNIEHKRKFEQYLP